MLKRLSLIIALAIWFTGCASVSETDESAIKTMKDTVTVLKTTRDIEAGEEFTADMVTTAEVPTAFLPPAPLFAGDLAEWEGMPVMLKVGEGRILEGRDFEPPTCAEAASGPAIPRAAAVTPAAQQVSRKSPNGKAQITSLATGDNAFVGILSMEAGAEVPAHRDETEEYIYVLEGDGTITIDGTEHAVAPGTMIFMPANAEVSFKSGEKPLKAVQVFAGPDPAKKYDAWSAE